MKLRINRLKDFLQEMRRANNPDKIVRVSYETGARPLNCVLLAQFFDNDVLVTLRLKFLSDGFERYESAKKQITLLAVGLDWECLGGYYEI